MIERAIKRIYAAILWVVVYPFLYILVSLKSAKTDRATRSQASRILRDTDYDGAPILLLALFQKGELRADLVRLVKEARALGIYVVGVNTKALKDTGDLFDCYIERRNFGRDFGSYQDGFLHLFKSGAADRCPRLIMCNDSVYYTRDRLGRFLTDLRDCETEVLGSTENFEYEYHLGSFCISMSGDILRHKTFRDFWKDYRLTDVRPRVIQKGEMALSAVLKSCVTSQKQIGALYNINRYQAFLEGEGSALDIALASVRRSGDIPWYRFDPRNVEAFLDEAGFIPRTPLNAHAAAEFGAEIGAIHDYASLEAYLLKDTGKTDETSHMARDAVIAELMKVFLSSSQIHNSATVLLHLGLPIVKLDALYRGVFGIYDTRRLCDAIGGDDGKELSELLLSRPFGGDNFRGLKRAFFSFGLV